MTEQSAIIHRTHLLASAVQEGKTYPKTKIPFIRQKVSHHVKNKQTGENKL